MRTWEQGRDLYLEFELGLDLDGRFGDVWGMEVHKWKLNLDLGFGYCGRCYENGVDSL